jgi:ribonuclease D
LSAEAGTWIDTARGVDELASRLKSVGSYCLDTEFHRERTYFPQLALIQINLDGDIFLVDPTVVDLDIVAGLFDNDALVVLHAAQQDLDVLQLTCGSRLNEIFDTQIAAGFVGYSTPSLASLVQRELDISLPKGDRLTDWLRRPLSDDQKTYAAADVRYLPALHAAITRQLDEVGRVSWAAEACRELAQRPSSLVDPVNAWLRVKDVRTLKPRARGVAQAVAQWREERAQRLNIPVRHVLADLALLGIAQRAPRTVDELAQSRGVDVVTPKARSHARFSMPSSAAARSKWPIHATTPRSSIVTCVPLRPSFQPGSAKSPRESGSRQPSSGPGRTSSISFAVRPMRGCGQAGGRISSVGISRTWWPGRPESPSTAPGDCVFCGTESQRIGAPSG